MSGMWGINRNCICGYLLGGGYSISCTRVCVCCRRVNVHQSIQPCLQSLILVIYSEAEQGHAFETAPGEQIKGKGSSPSSWKISTPGTVTRTHSPDTILIRVHTHSRRLGWEASSFHLLKCLFLLFSQSGQPPDTVTSICGSLSACVPLHSITWATGPCNTSVLEDRFFFFLPPHHKAAYNTSKSHSWVFDTTTGALRSKPKRVHLNLAKALIPPALKFLTRPK